MIDYKDLAKEWPKGDLEKLSHAVAEVYTSAIRNDEPPTQAVAKAFKKHYRTAIRMVTKARELGILKETGKGVGMKPRNYEKSDWELINLQDLKDHYLAKFESDSNPGLCVTLCAERTADKYLKITDFEMFTTGDEATITAAGIRDIPYGLLSHTTKKAIREVRNDF